MRWYRIMYLSLYASTVEKSLKLIALVASHGEDMEHTCRRDVRQHDWLIKHDLWIDNLVEIPVGNVYPSAVASVQVG